MWYDSGMLITLFAVFVWIVFLAGGVTGLHALLDRLEPHKPLHMFLATLSFLLLVAFAFLGLFGIVAISV
jgi:Na+/proline symporter